MVPRSERRRRQVLVGVAGLAALLAACAGPAAVQQELSGAQSVVAIPPLSTSSETSADTARVSGSEPAIETTRATGADSVSSADTARATGAQTAPDTHAAPTASAAPGEPDPRATAGSSSTDASTGSAGSPAGSPATSFTIAFAGDVNFVERTAARLAADPKTAFGVAAPGLAAADLTLVNLETAITTRGSPEPKSFTFRAPPSALTALRAAGVDVASMANNHGADYGETGLRDSIAAIKSASFPVIGIGADDTHATAPFRTTINGAPVTVFAASAVHDHTLATWTATGHSPGIASAFDPRLVDHVRTAAANGETVIVFLHWGTEYDSCPDADQQQLADELAKAGATAVVGAHAHVLQGAGWRPDGVYVAYGLSNYLWWRSFGNEQDDNGVLTLTIDNRRVIGSAFAASHLDDTGVPVPATGAPLDRINAEWDQVRTCTDLSNRPPG